jgi:glyoxylase-like metal-dependent hydrolase (beta-lactamase superfamily II)
MKIHTIDLDFQGIKQVIAAFAIEHEDGLVLIESGPYSCWTRLKQGLHELGFEASDVTHLLLTHVHFDHAGAAWALAQVGAKVYVHPSGERHLADPDRLWNSAARIYGEAGMELLWGKMEGIPHEQLISCEDGQIVQAGNLSLIAHHSPGHAKHHIAWQLEDALFTGDVGGVRILGGPVEPPCPPPDIDAIAWRESISKLRSLAEVKHLYLTHFGLQESNVQEHWDTLEKRLEEWIAFVEQRPALSDEALITEFDRFVASTRSAYAGAEDAYALANPSSMSVSGIRRWISKRNQAIAEAG